MFSIIDTGLVKVLVWFSPGSRAISTLAPRPARAAIDRSGIPDPSLILPHTLVEGAVAAGVVALAGSSHTPAWSDMHESSHTQEFTAA
jgi:hypothetical protein